MTDVKRSERRIHNLEISLQAYAALVGDLLPPSYAESTNAMLEDHFTAAETLGFDGGNGCFKKGRINPHDSID